MPLILSPAQRRALRGRAHALHPVVSISQNGLSDAVLAEIDRSLEAHELIKIRCYGVEREGREALLQLVCERLGCAAVQQIGNLLVVFRAAPEPATKPAAPPKRPRAKPASRRAAEPATNARRRATPNPPRRANNVRGR